MPPLSWGRLGALDTSGMLLYQSGVRVASGAMPCRFGWRHGSATEVAVGVTAMGLTMAWHKSIAGVSWRIDLCSRWLRLPSLAPVSPGVHLATMLFKTQSASVYGIDA